MSEHELWNELGNLYFMGGAYNQAVHAYERSIQSDTSFGRPYSNLALTYVQQGKYEEAIELYRRSIELLAEDKERAISWNRLGAVYRHHKDYSKAVIAFQEADLLDPRSADDFPATSEVHPKPTQEPSSVLQEPAPQPIHEDVAAQAAAEGIAEEPVAEAATEPIMELVDQSLLAPAEVLLDQSLEVPVEELLEPRAEAPAEELPEEPAEAPDEEPIAELDLAALLPLVELPEPEPQPEPEAAPLIAELERDEPEPVIEWEPLPAELDTVPEATEPDLDEVELWAIDEERILSATSSQPLASLASDDPTASWTPADPSQFQQDLSQMPETGSLTTWGDGDFDDDFEFFPAVGTDADQELPDPDAEKIATWIPLPEEAPVNLDEVWVPPFVEQEEAEAELPLEWNEAPAYQAINSVDYGPSVSPAPSTPDPIEYLQRSQLLPARAAATQQAWDQLDVDVIVEERPSSDLALGTQESPKPVEPPTVAQMLEQEPAHALSLNAQPPALPDSERDEEEMREIEMGIAKFRRVVQVNPRNSHAWDALGTLYKSAGLYKDAILAYQQAISNDSSKSLYYHHLGLVYACEGRDEDAIDAFQHVLEIDPDYSLAHATLGGYYRKMGLEELAQKHIGKAMKSIFDSENEYNRACLEAICGNADQAIELLGVALKNKQTYVDWILRDPDLDFIRQDPRFKQLISDYTR